MDTRSRLGHLLAFLAFASWGLLTPLGKSLLEVFGPWTLNAVRFTLALVVLAPFLGRAGWQSAGKLLRNPWLVGANLLANASLGLYILSLKDLPAAVATLTFYAAPLVAAAGAHVFLKERVGAAFVPVALVVVAGGYVALFGLAAPAAGLHWGAFGLALASTGVWSGYSILMRKSATEVDSRGLVGLSFVVAWIFFTLMALAFDTTPVWSQISTAAWVDMAWYVLFPTLISLALYTLAVQRVAAGPVNLWVGAELAFTFLFAWLLLGETYRPIQLAGAAVVLLGVTAYTFYQLRPQAP